MKKYYFIMIGVLVLLVYAMIIGIGISAYGKVDETRQADVAIVLGAGVFENEPSPVFRERINHGIWLYENGYVGNLIFTGGYSEGNDISDADVAKAYAVSQGVLEDHIFLEEKSTITQENLLYAKEIMRVQNFEHALIVSDPLHMKRAMLMAEDMEIDAYSSPTPTTKYQSKKARTLFLLREIFFYLGYQLYSLV